MPNPMLETLILDSLPPTIARESILEEISKLRQEIEHYRRGLQRIHNSHGVNAAHMAKVLLRGVRIYD